MDALMAALVAALLIHTTDRTAWFAARIGDRSRGAVFGVVLVVVATNILAALGGALLAPELSPNACDLLLAVALTAAGVGAFWPLQPPPSPRSHGVVGGMTGGALLMLGDRTVFVTLALAARTATPALAAVGASIGAIAIVASATVLGEHGRRRLPVTAIRVMLGALLTLAGVVQGLSALRLI